MSKGSSLLFNCHWSRQVSNMRHCWNKVFVMIIRVMVVINQAIVMSPFICFKNSNTNYSTKILPTSKNNFPIKLAVTWKFRTHRFVTALAIFLLIFYIAASPLMVKRASDLYSTTRRNQHSLFISIAKFTMDCDVICSLLIIATNICYRKDIVKILNLLNELLLRFEQLEKNLVELKIFVALVLKMSLSIYEMVLSLPFLISAAPRLSTQSIVAYLFTHYIQQLGSFFALNIFIFMLLLLNCSMQLEKQLECDHVVSIDLKMSQLISLQNSLQKLIVLVRNTFQYGISLIILLYFGTILANIYSMLDFYVTNHHLFRTFITYLLSIALEVYALIFVIHFCERSQRKVKDLFLQREELYFLKVFLF